MLNRLGIFVAVLLILSGGALLQGPISGPETSHTARLLAGAVLVSPGSVAIFPPYERLVALEKTLQAGRQTVARLSPTNGT